MKILKYSLLFASLLLLAGVMSSCKDDEGKGAGDAVVGFAKSAYVYKESAGTVRIPIQITGEPKKYPIVLNVEATIEGNVVPVSEVAHFVQLTGLRYIGKPEAPVAIEMQIIDNKEVNDSRFVKLTITSASGATIQNGTATIEVQDNDNNPYEKLWGNWSFLGTDSKGAKVPFDVNISGGFTDEEVEKNADKVLVCWGFGGQMEDVTGVAEPAKQPVWYINYDADSQALSVAVGTLMANIWSFTGIDEDCIVKTGSTLPGSTSYSFTDQIPVTMSADMNKLTFAPGYGLGATVWGVGGDFYGTWYRYSDIVMTRK